MKESGKNKIGIALAVLLLAAIAGLYAYIYLIPGITGALTPTVTVTNGSMRNVETAFCTVIREEYPVYAQEEGTVSYYSKETEKTRKGSKVLDVYPPGGSGVAYRADTTGFVSYYLDGYEDYFSVEGIPELEPEQLNSSLIIPEKTVLQEVETGDILFKLVTSDTWYMVLTVPAEKKDVYVLSSSVTVELEKGSVKATVSEVYDKGSMCLVVLKTNRYYEDFAKLRQFSADVVTSDYDGLIVPLTAIAEEDGQQGVYVLGISGSYSFVPVEILTQNETDALVSSKGSLRIYDTVKRSAGEDEQGE